MSLLSENFLSAYAYDRERLIWTVPGQSRDFDYSDGDEIEQRLLGIVSSASDLSSTSLELNGQVTDWPSLYHMSPKRSNLLRPLQDKLCGRILEIGAGCGAITRFLGETGAELCAVEGSARRASVAAARCRDLGNVSVIADAFHNVPAVPEFDVVTLIGVLEYARLYFPSLSGDPVDAMLMHARRFLRPEGILLVAIENQLGLKYFAGYAEDHTGIPMFGIEDCYSGSSVVTFGRKELQARIAATGLDKQRLWFPFPDYKLPDSVLSDRILDPDVEIDIGPLLSGSVVCDPLSPAVLAFSLEQAWQPIVRNKLFGELANSFLVVASRQEVTAPEGKVLGYHYAAVRRPEFAKEVRFEIVDKQVMSCPRRLFPEAKASGDLPISMHLTSEMFAPGVHWQGALVRIVNTPGWCVRDVGGWADTWFTALLEYAGISGDRQQLSARHTLSGDLFDATPHNLIIGSGSNPLFFDQEWQLDRPIEIGFLVLRGVLHSLLSVHSFSEPAPGTPSHFIDLFLEVAAILGVDITDEDLAAYATFESDIQSWVSNGTWCSIDVLRSFVLPVRSNISTKLYLQNRVNELENDVEMLRNNITALTGTYSWRITAPLRWLACKMIPGK